MLQNFKHQTEVVDRFKDLDKGAILLEMGLGKTRIAIQIAEHKYTKGEITAVLIVMPKSLLTNWARIEIPRHGTLEYNIYNWKERGPQFFRPGKLQYFIVNHDAIITPRFQEVFKMFLSVHKNFMLVAEESTGFKSGRAKRTKRILQIARIAKARFILTGAPITQGPLDAFSQFEILTPGALGHRSIISFRAHYAVMQRMKFGPRVFDKIVGYQNLPELSSRINKLGVIIKKEEVLDLPKQLFRKFPVELTADQAVAYEDLRDKALAYIDSHEITAMNAISLVNKLLQVCSGQMRTLEKYLELQTDRIETVKELVEECAGKTVIWSAFIRSGQLIAEALGTDAVHVIASDSQDVRFAKLQAFREGSKKALVMNPASGGVGITLTESSNVIYYDRSFSYEHRIQSLARTHRIGQTNNVLVTDLYAPNTLEERVIEILKEKERLANLVMSKDHVINLLNWKGNGA
jgi:SNF2 family DNA or RNA helicase